MRKFKITLLCSFVALISVLFAYYMTKITEDDSTLSTETVYQLAKESGYEGTIEDFINEFRGAIGNDGRGIASAVVNSEGHLIVTYTDLTVVDAGLVNAESITLAEGISGSALNKALSSSVSVFVKIDEDSYAIGAGVIYKIDKSAGVAYIITNYHVLKSASEDISKAMVSVYLHGREYPIYEMAASYVGGSASYDIAVLKVKSSLIKESSCSNAKLGNSELVSVLDTVMAIGNPAGNGISVTQGKVNKESEKRYIDTGASDGPIFMRVIRTDAAINKGNSGGGLYAADGSLVGIVTAKDPSSSSDNMAYAIPVNVAAAVAENIIYYCDGRENINGKIPKLGIGLEVIYANVVYDDESGECIKTEVIAVKYIEKGSIAERVGLKVGDVLKSVSLDGNKINISKEYQAPELNISARPGSVIVYDVIRVGEEVKIVINVPSVLSEIP